MSDRGHQISIYTFQFNIINIVPKSGKNITQNILAYLRIADNMKGIIIEPRIVLSINLLEFILGKFKYSSFKKVFYYFIFLAYLICIFMFKYNDYPIQGLTLMGYFTLVGISTFLFNLLNKNKPIPRRIQKK